MNTETSTATDEPTNHDLIPAAVKAKLVAQLPDRDTPFAIQFAALVSKLDFIQFDV